MIRIFRRAVGRFYRGSYFSSFLRISIVRKALSSFLRISIIPRASFPPSLHFCPGPLFLSGKLKTSSEELDSHWTCQTPPPPPPPPPAPRPPGPPIPFEETTDKHTDLFALICLVCIIIPNLPSAPLCPSFLHAPRWEATDSAHRRTLQINRTVPAGVNANTRFTSVQSKMEGSKRSGKPIIMSVSEN